MDCDQRKPIGRYKVVWKANNKRKFQIQTKLCTNINEFRLQWGLVTSGKFYSVFHTFSTRFLFQIVRCLEISLRLSACAIKNCKSHHRYQTTAANTAGAAPTRSNKHQKWHHETSPHRGDGILFVLCDLSSLLYD
ncbi:MAG: hypothetical protein MHMPM18_001382 [Marteilia pararefringens]